MYSSPDPATKKVADDWLTKFQQTPTAWQVADQILSSPDAPAEFRFFAAQTMRTKLQFDFYELPAESYLSLRDSLIAHIDRFRGADHQPIHTQLVISLADLAIQMDSAWPNPVQTIFERFSRSPESYASLLEVLRMLPEETANLRLMTEHNKRANSQSRIQDATSQVIQFLLTIQCPTQQAKKKVFECFLAWIKYTHLQPNEIAQNPLVPECFKQIAEGGDLAEIGTDIIIDVLRMACGDLGYYQPVIQVMLAGMVSLRQKFEKLMALGAEAALNADLDGMLQICRIYVETGETLIPLILEQMTNSEVLGILQVILRCTDLPSQEISSIPLDFWHRLAHEVSRHPETDAKIDQFKGLYTELLCVVIRRVTLSTQEDPFQAEDDYVAYRRSFLGLAEDVLDILTPNSALEQVLKSLQEGQRLGVAIQEAHFYVLTCVASKAEVCDGSVLWHLIQSLPPLIAQPAPDTTPEGIMLSYTKTTAIELLGNLWKWLKSRPDFLRSALNMISSLLLAPQPPPGSAANVLERTKQLQQAAAIAFKDICHGGRQHLQDLVPQLVQLFVGTMHLSTRMHMFVVDGVAAVVVGLQQDQAFMQALEQLIQPLAGGLQSEREKPQVLGDIFDRLTTIVRQITVREGTAKAVNVGNMITNYIWPIIRGTLSVHAADDKVVEKGCRLLKHSVRCVPDLFKPNVPSVAQTLITAFQQHKHSSYLYIAEVLASVYPEDPEIQPVLRELFHNLSSTGLQCLLAATDRFEEISELVEDFFGMFERYLRYVPRIVLESQTLVPTLQLWHVAIFVQQKDTMEAVIAMIESTLSLVAETGRRYEDRKAQLGAALRPMVLQVCPAFVEALFRLIAGVPTTYVQDSIPSIIDSIRRAFPQEFGPWLENAVRVLPPSVCSKADLAIFGPKILHGDPASMSHAIQDLCYRCEQVALRNRDNQKGRRGRR